MTRDVHDARRWMRHGTTLYLDGVAGLDDSGLDAASGLPGWSRRQLVAHVAANAEALGNLVRWAQTGVETPMYASPEARARGIEDGASKPTPELLAWASHSAEALESAMDRLSDAQWTHDVRTAQGRTVPATEIPWLRARETCVHAVDLCTGTGFGDLTADFLTELGADIVAKRNSSTTLALRLVATDAPVTWELAGPHTPVVISAPLTDLVAYLSGRTTNLSTDEGSPAPALPAWL